MIAALGISMISTINLNNSPPILPSAAFAAQQQEQKFTAKMTGSEEAPPKNRSFVSVVQFQAKLLSITQNVS